jgi:hypothetical protein
MVNWNLPELYMYIIDEWADERNIGILARDKNIKCIFFGTYKTEVKMNKVCFFVIKIVTYYKQNITIATKRINIVILHAFLSCQIKKKGFF